MSKDSTIHLLIIHQHEEEAERIISILRNAQMPIRPHRSSSEEELTEHLTNNRVDIILIEPLQNGLTVEQTIQCIKRNGKDIPLIALLEILDNDAISESYEAGIREFTSGNIPDQLRSNISNVFDSLITRRKLRSNEADLNDAENRCKTLLDSSKDAIAYIHDGMHVYTNTAYLEFFKYDDPEEMEVTPFLDLVAKEQVPKIKKLLRDIATEKIPDEEISMKLKAENGDLIEAVVSLDNATIDGEPCVQFLVQPPKANTQAEKELKDMKTKDMLTGFYNRSYFSDDIATKINAVKSGKSKGHSLLYIQIDNDEQLEKELGKGNLDLLIADIAPYINDIFGDKVTYYRYDETVFIIEMKTSIEKATKYADHLVKKMKEKFFSAGEKTLSCSVSISLTQIIEKTESSTEIIETLYSEVEKAREKGGSQISVFDPAEEEKLAKIKNQKLIDLITQGLKDDNFVLHYQSVISLQGEETEHYETLVRLIDGEKTLMPVDFIAIASRYGLILDIDRHVISKAIVAIKNYNKDVELFVKMSTDTLSDLSFPGWLTKELKKYGVAGNKIIFETPESALVSHSKQVKPVIQAIKGLNCQFAIEKFGSGLNSFTLLKHYPVDFIKIDSTFMEDFANSEENQNIVKDIIDKAHAQNKQVICEFVQDANTMSILWKFNANYVQGNFLSPASDTMVQEAEKS